MINTRNNKGAEFFHSIMIDAQRKTAISITEIAAGISLSKN